MYVLREDFRCTLYGLWEGENRIGTKFSFYRRYRTAHFDSDG